MLINCRVSKIESFIKNIYKVYLILYKPIDFKAGQYISTKISDKKQLFSIANCPTETGMIELHIGSSDVNSSLDTIHFFANALIENNCIEIDAPHGEAWLRDNSNKPLLLIAGGTGFSYINSILKSCLSKKLSQPIYIYWGVKNSDFLYADKELTALSIKHSNLHYVPVVIEDNKGKWSGKKGTVLDAILNDFTDISSFDIYVCGPSIMVKAVKEQLISKKNAKLEQMFSDAFSYH
ncbi:flavin mononucleotide reductase LuxG [Iodobacter ciconiae]|uniref:NAD(P)H-flavin reductase n=1 Tax=Iodobacter ciconiae TaxID=2496266 RepID=A0A3S8ZRR5_9NEIS|nr:NAD(P)H-flavin reductase [Iodobacter ciconiae]AZN36200.1 NAD(P)H-flavin reductase [Iodobacter ciconiae]